MLLGCRDHFVYVRCSDCGCLQIAEMPSNLSKYYPDNYYSLQAVTKKKARLVRDYIRKSSSLYYISGKGIIGRLLALFKSPDPLHLVYRRIGLKSSDKILDVGGGSGSHALSLQRIGFKNALSVDPFIPNNISYGNVLIAKKAELFDIQGQYDLITFHHSLEHMQDQCRVLRKAGELIGESGRILIRIPTVTSVAWDEYKENWVNLDAPRHFYLHSHRSIKLVAEQAHLKVLDLWNDSVAMQFWGSEQYMRDIPLTDPISYSQNKDASIFSATQIINYERKSIALNKEGKGDWICIVLGKSGASF